MQMNGSVLARSYWFHLVLRAQIPLQWAYQATASVQGAVA